MDVGCQSSLNFRVFLFSSVNSICLQVFKSSPQFSVYTSLHQDGIPVKIKKASGRFGQWHESIKNQNSAYTSTPIHSAPDRTAKDTVHAAFIHKCITPQMPLKLTIALYKCSELSDMNY